MQNHHLLVNQYSRYHIKTKHLEACSEWKHFNTSLFFVAEDQCSIFSYELQDFWTINSYIAN